MGSSFSRIFVIAAFFVVILLAALIRRVYLAVYEENRRPAQGEFVEIRTSDEANDVVEHQNPVDARKRFPLELMPGLEKVRNNAQESMGRLGIRPEGKHELGGAHEK